MASHHHAAPAAARLGSVAARVASSAVCPVVIGPPARAEHVARTQRRGSMVCGFDGSSGSERALSIAVGLAERVGLEPLAISVDPARSPDDAGPARFTCSQATPFASSVSARPARTRGCWPLAPRPRSAPGGLLGSVTEALAAAGPVPVWSYRPRRASASPRSASAYAQRTVDGLSRRSRASRRARTREHATIASSEAPRIRRERASPSAVLQERANSATSATAQRPLAPSAGCCSRLLDGVIRQLFPGSVDDPFGQARLRRMLQPRRRLGLPQPPPERLDR